MVNAQAPGDAKGRATVTVQTKQGTKISPDLFGIFFEDINYAADGGLYAELVQNRSFEYTPQDNGRWNSLTAWELVTRGGGKGTVAVEAVQSLHGNNPNYALITVEQAGEGVGLVNAGFDGFALKAGEKYDLSLFARQDKGQTPLTIRLESKSGAVLAEAKFPLLTKDWSQYKATFAVSAADSDARLVVLAGGTGAVALDMVSLFPQKTFHNRPNGLRADLAQTIADLQPKFVRFPGGCLAHGDGINNIYRWKDTIGPVERRKAQPNIWRYHQTVGLGYHEYFQFCEDIGAKPLPVLAAGVSCQNSHQRWGIGQECIPLANMDEYIQDVLDLVEYANGPETSYWGAKRAAAGHPKPFDLQYLGIGNEDHITPEFRQRFQMIYEAVKTKYPKLTVIGTVGPSPNGEDFDAGWQFADALNLEMVDEHYYQSPNWFLDNLKRYDSYDRKKSKVYLGEYASRGNAWSNALSEAAYMAGLERNGDVVHLASYAPLLAREGHTQWNPDLIYFDSMQVAPTVNYYVQQLFSVNAGSAYLPNVVSFTPPVLPVTAPQPVSVFVGTWNTQAEFDDIRLESNGAAVGSSTFDKEASGWNGESGKWTVKDGVYVQSANAEPAISRAANLQATSVSGKLSYTYSLRARKTGGAEGFLIGFGGTDNDNYYWWNLGGWGNTEHGIEKFVNGSSQRIGTPVTGRIENNRWYDIKIVVNGNRFQCYLDGVLIQDVVDNEKTDTNRLVASSVRDDKTGDIVLKLVNPIGNAVVSQINLDGSAMVHPAATKTVLTGKPGDKNLLGQPQTVAPVTGNITVGKSFPYEAPPYSLTVIRIKTK